jgi:hypothetical protein
MSRLSRYRPSPAMIVACLALFVALGGVGYAAATIGSSQIKNNSIRSGDIRNSTITGKDVKNSGLTGSDIKNSSLSGRDVKNNSLLGADINESSLGTVPNATSLQGQGPGAFQPASKQLRFGPFTLNPGDADRTIGTFGPFTLRAECDAGPDGQLTLTTSEDNAYADSDETSDSDFDTGEDFNASEGDDEDDEINAASLSGTGITGQLYTVDDGGLGGGCHFWGEVTPTNG